MKHFENIYPSEIDLLINKNDVFIIDLRNNIEYRKKHIRGAVNIQYEHIKKNMNIIPKDKIVMVYCSSGARSLQVARMLATEGYLVKNVIGGIKKYYGSSLT